MTHEKKLDIFEKYGQTIVIICTILSTVCGSLIWMNGKFNDIDEKFAIVDKEMEIRFANMEKDMAIIKTVLLMKKILPSELAKDQ